MQILWGGVKSIAAGPAELLRGEISGVRVSAVDNSPNGLQNVNIRGLNTLRGESQPLWIVDGAVLGSSVNQNLNAFYLSGGTTTNGDQLPDYSGEHYTSPLSNFGWLSPYEIESIEVVKDMSAAALYGMQGANGVVIINTRRPTSGHRNIMLDSNVGVELSSQKGDAFKTGIITTHNLGVNGIFGKGSYYNVSGFLRYNDASIVNTNSISGGLAVNIAMTANERFGFGFNSYLGYGDYISASGTNFIGGESLISLARYPNAFSGSTLQEWVQGYDDETIDCRTVNSVWIKINFLRYLHLKVTGGLDYQNQTRYIWYGPETSFGEVHKGATSILNNSLMNFNLKGELNFDRSFAVKHHLKASLVYDLNGNINKTNAMCGTEFRNPALRGKGLSGSGSLHSIRKFDRSYVQMGGYLFAGYDFDGYAGVTGVVRMDYTKRVDNELVWFPSAEAFVDVRKIAFRNSRILSALKLSGGYGRSGREMLIPYEYMSAYISGVPEVEKGSETYFDGFNRLISDEWNLGFNVGFLNERFTLAVKYYDKKTSDSFKVINYGKKMATLWVENTTWNVEKHQVSTIGNKGIELDLYLRPIHTRNVNWSLYANASFNTNIITSIDPADYSEIPDVIDGTYLSNNKEGASVAQSCGMNTIPKCYGGFGTTLSLYGFTLDARFSGAGGFNIVNAGKLLESGRSYILAEDVERGDYLRLDCLTLSYNVPLRVRWMKGFKVNMSAHNLFTVTHYSGWNPDVNSFGVTARTYGLDYGSFPVCRSVVLGLSFKF